MPAGTHDTPAREVRAGAAVLEDTEQHGPAQTVRMPLPGGTPRPQPGLQQARNEIHDGCAVVRTAAAGGGRQDPGEQQVQGEDGQRRACRKPWRSPGAGRRGGRTTVSPALSPTHAQARTRDRVLSVPPQGGRGVGSAPQGL